LFLIQADILRPLRKAVGKSTKIVYRLGNHDRRMMSMAENNPTALAEMLKTILRHRSPYLEDLLQLDRYGVRLSHKPVDTLYDRWNFVHGVKTTANAAKFNLQRYGNGTSGHSHRMSTFTQQMQGRLGGWWESGCLRTIDSVEYLPFGDRPDWAQG